eukprot:scaffold53011_cov36-Tisochrysis_lutea.AAC.1
MPSREEKLRPELHLCVSPWTVIQMFLNTRQHIAPKGYGGARRRGGNLSPARRSLAVCGARCHLWHAGVRRPAG